MRKQKVRATAALLALTMTAALCGCGRNGAQDEEESGQNATGMVYTASFASLQMDAQVDYLQAIWEDANGALCGVGQYVTGTVTETLDDGTEYAYNETAPGLLRFSFDETGGAVELVRELALSEILEGYEGGSNIYSAAGTPDGGLWLLENTYTYTFDLPEGFNEETDEKWNYYVAGDDDYRLRRLDADGNELLNIDIRALIASDSEYFYANDMFADADDLFIITDDCIAMLDSDGALQFTLETDSWVNGCVMLPDGTAAFQVYDYEADGYQLRTIDSTAQDWGASQPIGEAIRLYTGDESYDIYYYDYSGLFYGYDVETAEGTLLFNLLNCDIDVNSLEMLFPRADGSIICITGTWNSDYTERTYEVATIREVEASSLPQETTLTYACFGMDYYIRRQILAFNKQHDDARIEIVDYSQYNTDEDYSAGQTKLTTEILAGNVPDLFYSTDLPLDRFAAKGVLEDLWPWIEQDTELGGREALVQPVFDALSSRDGALYQIVPSFTICTACGLTDVVGDKMGWTLDDMQAALETLPDGADIYAYSYTKADVLRDCLSFGMDEFIDWETGTCSFDSEAFLNILRFVDLFPAELDWESIDYSLWTSSCDGDEYVRIRNGEQFLYKTTIYDIWDYWYTLSNLGDVTFVGIPTGSGNGSAFNISSTGLSMSATCADKELAWEFMRALLTEDYQDQNVWSLPTNQACFDAALQEMMQAEISISSNGSVTVSTDSGGMSIGVASASDLSGAEDDPDYDTLTQAQADQLLALIEATDRIYEYDSTIYDVVSEECAAFFARDKTAEETAKLVQSRLNIYVNEQR